MSSKSKKSSLAYSVKTDSYLKNSSPAETIKTESSLRDKLDSLSAKPISNKSKKTWMGLEWQTPKSSSKSSSSTSPKSSGQKLPNDILYLLADKSSPDTKRTIKEVNKDLKNYIIVSPTSGRKVGNEILTYLRKDKHWPRDSDTLYLRSYEYPNHSLRIITEPQRNGNGKQLLIRRYRPNELPEVISKVYKYNGKESEVFKDIKLSELIKKSKQNYVSKFLHGVE